jgi:hypothetical protein
MCFDFPKTRNFRKKMFFKKWFKPCQIPYGIPNNVVIKKLNPNPNLVNINNLKPYKMCEEVFKGLEVQLDKGRDFQW